MNARPSPPRLQRNLSFALWTERENLFFFFFRTIASPQDVSVHIGMYEGLRAMQIAGRQVDKLVECELATRTLTFATINYKRMRSNRECLWARVNARLLNWLGSP